MNFCIATVHFLRVAAIFISCDIGCITPGIPEREYCCEVAGDEKDYDHRKLYFSSLLIRSLSIRININRHKIPVIGKTHKKICAKRWSTTSPMSNKI